MCSQAYVFPTSMHQSAAWPITLREVSVMQVIYPCITRPISDEQKALWTSPHPSARPVIDQDVRSPPRCVRVNEAASWRDSVRALPPGLSVGPRPPLIDSHLRSESMAHPLPHSNLLTRGGGEGGGRSRPRCAFFKRCLMAPPRV